MRPICSLDGQILPLAEARIDPTDRGFLFGDALYETVKVVAGRILHLGPHLERLRTGLTEVSIPCPPQLEAWMHELVDHSGLVEGSVYVQVSRGAGPRVHLPAPGMRPTVLLLPVEGRCAPPATRRMTAVTMADPRWARCDVKTTSLMATVLGKLAARDAGADEVLFRGPRGELREGGSTSLFVRRGNRLETHRHGRRILSGVTRRLLLGLAKAEGMPVAHRAPRLGERASWQECLLCGTLTGVQAVVALDGETVGDGEIGAWTRRLGSALAALEARLVRSHRRRVTESA